MGACGLNGSRLPAPAGTSSFWTASCARYQPDRARQLLSSVFAWLPSMLFMHEYTQGTGHAAWSLPASSTCRQSTQDQRQPEQPAHCTRGGALHPTLTCRCCAASWSWWQPPLPVDISSSKVCEAQHLALCPTMTLRTPAIGAATVLCNLPLPVGMAGPRPLKPGMRL